MRGSTAKRCAASFSRLKNDSGVLVFKSLFVYSSILTNNLCDLELSRGHWTLLRISTKHGLIRLRAHR